MSNVSGPSFYVDLRTVLLCYIVLMAVFAIVKLAVGQGQLRAVCDHPVDMQRLDVEHYEYLSTGEIIVCEQCGRELAVALPAIIHPSDYKPEYAERIILHEKYVSQVRASIEARQVAKIKTRVETMSGGVGYSYPDRQSISGRKDYRGGTSSGVGWEIRWNGPYNQGPTAIDAMRAIRDHLTHLQNTTAASEPNAKLLFHAIKAIEEFDGVAPTIGGSLNDLIPKAEPE